MPFSHTDNQILRAAGASRKAKDTPYPHNPQTIAEHLLKARLDLKLTKLAVATRLGVTPSTISTWESGRCEPDVRSLKKVISFLGYYPFDEPTTWQGKVKKYRNIHGFTLEQFGQLMGVNGATVWTWENQVYIPSSKTIEKIKLLIKAKAN